MTGDRNELCQGIARAINGASAETGSNTPDFILAEFLVTCLEALDFAVRWREAWYEPSTVTIERRKS